jgi:hypothetical protein
MPDEYTEETARAWDRFSDAIKHLSRDWMPGFAPKATPSALWLGMTRMQNASALQAAALQYPSNFNQPSPNFSPISGIFGFLGL